LCSVGCPRFVQVEPSPNGHVHDMRAVPQRADEPSYAESRTFAVTPGACIPPPGRSRRRGEGKVTPSAQNDAEPREGGGEDPPAHLVSAHICTGHAALRSVPKASAQQAVDAMPERLDEPTTSSRRLASSGRPPQQRRLGACASVTRSWAPKALPLCCQRVV
jgi:hypothetical protein